MISGAKPTFEQQQHLKFYKSHLERLKQYRPNTTSINFNTPQPHILSKKKKQSLQLTKQLQIQRENQCLLKKINNISAKEGRYFSIDAHHQRKVSDKSMNFRVRRRQKMESIDFQNMKLLKRINQRRSEYSRDKMLSQWKQNKIVMKNIALYPFVLGTKYSSKTKQRQQFEATFLNSAQNQQQFQLSSLSSPIKMVRLRTINDINLILTISLNQQVLRIVAQDKKHQIVKIIEIPRIQAMMFIQGQCFGQFQGLFDLVYYENQVLYLISRFQKQKMIDQRKGRIEKQQFLQGMKIQIK